MMKLIQPRKVSAVKDPWPVGRNSPANRAVFKRSSIAGL
jgi:hypothetical protein